MRYLQATFKNYIGFYNGMGLYDVSIDFRKCTHNIILITGKNGSGKSTLMEHLNPFPDPSSSFIPNKTAEKHLVLQDGQDVYSIQIVSPADLKGRKTTKAYIQKNGTELNENGNISSYKEIVFDEFELDSNYISLSRLSNSDRGLGDKTPSERKRFVSNIIDNLEIYNTIYKTLNKKSLIYKSHTNTIHTKIQNIGNAENLKSRLKMLQAREVELNREIMNCNNTIVSIEAKNSIDEEEALRIKAITDKKNEIQSRLSVLETQVKQYHHKTKIDPDSISAQYEADKNLLTTYENNHKELVINWKAESERLSETESNINSLRANLEYNVSETDIVDRYNKSKELLQEISTELTKMGITKDTTLSELEKVITFCERFANAVDNFNDGLTPVDIEYIVTTYNNISINDMMSDQNSIISKIENGKQYLVETQEKLKILSTLENRPSNCTIDTCPFIANAVKIKNESEKDIIDTLASLQEQNLELSNKVSEIQAKIDYHTSLYHKKVELDAITREVSEIAPILKKYYPNFVDNFMIRIRNCSSFGIIRDHKLPTDAANLLRMYEAETQKNQLLELEYKSYREKVQLINSSKNMLVKMEENQANLIKSIAKIKSDIDSYTSTINELRTKVNLESEYNANCLRYLEVKKEFDAVMDRVNEYKHKESKALEALASISSLRENISRLSNELAPLMQEINTINGQLNMLESYYEEYNRYKQSYDIIETLKKYCSPTSGGIQTLFMQLYMSKTKDIANSILSMLFNGSYSLGDFIINENEFRIPFIGEGLPVDDISSGSGAQIAMMGMIINLVLLHQASTKFNIAQLDEVTAALDSYNNSLFTNIMFYCMQILNIDQLFLISHSTETDNSYADIIKLKGYDNYESAIQSGNVIWDFNEIIKQ